MAEPLHPLFVHLPLALSALMPLVAGGLLLAWHKGWLPRRAFAIAVLLQAALTVSGFAARYTGEQDEERVEAVVGDDPIHAHEEAADFFVIAAAGTLLLLILGLALKGRAGKGLALVGTLASGAVLFAGIRVGHLGGEIVYQHGGAAAWKAGAAPPAGAHHEGDDDHD
ncbi:MAG: DUF2231 domain-containing protein [bacterium]